MEKANSFPKKGFWKALITKGEFISSLLVLAASVYLIRVCSQIPQIQPSGQFSVQVWPRFMLLWMIAISLIKIAKVLIALRRSRQEEASTAMKTGGTSGSADAGEVDGLEEVLEEIIAGDGVPAEAPVERNFKIVVAASVLFFCYLFLFDAVGFLFSTLMFYIAFLLYTGERKKPFRLTLITVLGTLSLLYLFVKVVYLPLPLGEGVITGVSTKIYHMLGIF